MRTGITKEQVLKRIDAVMAKAAATMSTSSQGVVSAGPLQTFRSAGLSVLADLYGEDHFHYRDFVEQTADRYVTNAARAQGLIGVVREEVEQDLLATTRALIAAELFSDFLEMADHLLREGYKDAAAVIAGSSLEAHLRRLCGTSVEVLKPNGDPKKADTINADLHKANRYELSVQKQITAWLGIRNDAAHGDYGKVVEGSVKLMIDGIRHFMSIHPT